MGQVGEELQILKKVLKTKSQAQVAVALGYRSANTILSWLQNKKIPKTAMERVRRYLKIKE